MFVSHPGSWEIGRATIVNSIRQCRFWRAARSVYFSRVRLFISLFCLVKTLSFSHCFKIVFFLSLSDRKWLRRGLICQGPTHLMNECTVTENCYNAICYQHKFTLIKALWMIRQHFQVLMHRRETFYAHLSLSFALRRETTISSAALDQRDDIDEECVWGGIPRFLYPGLYSETTGLLAFECMDLSSMQLSVPIVEQIGAASCLAILRYTGMTNSSSSRSNNNDDDDDNNNNNNATTTSSGSLKFTISICAPHKASWIIR